MYIYMGSLKIKAQGQSHVTSAFILFKRRKKQ